MVLTEYRLFKALKYDFRREDYRFTQATKMVAG
jgi:hypothetical protein